MKKTGLIALIALSALSLGGCGNSKKVTEAKLTATYIGTFSSVLALPDYEMEQAAVDNYVISTYDDSTYVMTLVKYMDMYGTPGSVTTVTTGSFAQSTNKDGDTLITLSDAQSIVYTTCGMFAMQYSWNSGLTETTFPVELLGSTSAHNTLEDLQTRFGKGFTFSVKSGTNYVMEAIDSTAAAYSGEAKAHTFVSALTSIYIGTKSGSLDLPDYQMSQAAVDNYTVMCFADGTYSAAVVKYMDMYGTPGSVTTSLTGTYTNSTNKDGDTIVACSAADSIVYTTCGMFAMQYSWNTALAETAFPVEFLGSTSAHNTLDDLKSTWGQAFTFSVKSGTTYGIEEFTEGGPVAYVASETSASSGN